MLISTGSQGEPMSALARMAGRDHPIRIAEGDTVILASSLVPGNETAVSRIINDLTRLGAIGWCTGATRWCTCPGTHPPGNCSTC